MKTLPWWALLLHHPRLRQRRERRWLPPKHLNTPIQRTRWEKQLRRRPFRRWSRWTTQLPPRTWGASWEASQAVCLGDNLAVRSVELSVARGVPYRSHLRSCPHRSELFAWAPTSKHQGRPFRSNPNIRYSRGKRMSRAPRQSTP